MYRSRCKNTRRKLKYCEEDNDGVMGHHSHIIIQTQPSLISSIKIFHHKVRILPWMEEAPVTMLLEMSNSEGNPRNCT